MSSPVELSDLPTTGSAASTDLTLLRKGLTDYKITVQNLLNIMIAQLPSPSPNYGLANDLLMINRGGVNFQLQLSQIGFAYLTQAWFYQSTAPTGWTIIPNTGDMLLACAGGGTYTTAGSQQGTWQQPNATLTVNQIPQHTHNFGLSPNGYGNNPLQASGSNSQSASFQQTSYGMNGISNANPAGLPHNHGNSYRPFANVGILCNKTS